MGSTGANRRLVVAAIITLVAGPEPLTREMLKADPLDQFSGWFDEAVAALGREAATAMCVSTINLDGFPDGRMTLLKHADADGFVFYTNLHSVKGRSLIALPKAALTFFWGSLERQVRIKGPVENVSDTEADAYFASRARRSQIGAWASDQSALLPSRETLDHRLEEFEKKFTGRDVPRPPYWSGFRIRPFEVEFWQGRPNRLHDRFVYRKNSFQSWEIISLYP